MEEKWKKQILRIALIFLITFACILIYGKACQDEKITRSKSPASAHSPKRITPPPPPEKPTFSLRISKQGILEIPGRKRVIVKKANGQILRLRKGDYVNLRVVEGEYNHLAFVSGSGSRKKLKPLPKAKSKIKITSVQKSDSLILENTGKGGIKVKIKIS